jgi:hypothetical protein
VKTRNAEYHGIWRNITEYAGISRHFPGIYRNITIFSDGSHATVCNATINVNPQRGGGGRAYVGYLIINCIPTLGILINILAPSWGNLNRMTLINIVFIAIYCKMVGHLTNIYCPTVGHLIENLLKKSNALVPHICPTPHLWGLTLIGA